MAQIGTIQLPVTKAHVIRNDDMAIFDLICDLNVPGLIQTIEEIVNHIKGPGLLIIYSPLGAYVLFINRPPMHWLNEESKFFAIVAPNIDDIITVIQGMFNFSPDAFSRNVLQQVLNLLYNRKQKDNYKKVGP